MCDGSDRSARKDKNESQKTKKFACGFYGCLRTFCHICKQKLLKTAFYHSSKQKTREKIRPNRATHKNFQADIRADVSFEDFLLFRRDALKNTV